MANTPVRAAPFAHLLALVTGKPTSAKHAGDDAPEKDAEDEDKDKTDADEGDKPDDKAEGEDKDKSDDKPDGEGKKARRAKRAEKDEDEEAEEKAEDPDDDEEMAQARREGFEAAQARGRRIFNSAAAGKRPDMAAHLAFNETGPSAKAIGMLEMAASGTAPGAEPSRLHRRMQRLDHQDPGQGSPAKPGAKNEVDDFVAQAAAAAKKAGI